MSIRLATLSILMLCGCAPKKHQTLNNNPGAHKYQNCTEVAWDVKNQTVTVICPLEKK